MNEFLEKLEKMNTDSIYRFLQDMEDNVEMILKFHQTTIMVTDQEISISNLQQIFHTLRKNAFRWQHNGDLLCHAIQQCQIIINQTILYARMHKELESDMDDIDRIRTNVSVLYDQIYTNLQYYEDCTKYDIEIMQKYLQGK